ncbi:MAG: rhamnogalacturonan acetylesterase [Opitutaceae bacterium]|jgi:lysophospholipase L1-like esterase|nr:rhamnogalacturonan acetylesterase [Opitutaceae bacterium]
MKTSATLIPQNLPVAFAVLVVLSAPSVRAQSPGGAPAGPPKSARIAAAAAAPLNPGLPTLFVADDSTAAQDTPGITGWGGALPAFFDTGKINIANRARGGASSRSFITAGDWDRLLAEMKPGDFILIQFGHNDAGPVNTARRARGSLKGTGDEAGEIDNKVTKKRETVRTYGWYLRKMIAGARAKGAVPMLLSPTLRNEWPGGKPERENGRWREWAAEVARAEKVAFIDLAGIAAALYEQLGREAVARFYPKDRTHTGPEGAVFNAGCVVTGLKQLSPNPLEPYFSDKAADAR